MMGAAPVEFQTFVGWVAQIRVREDEPAPCGPELSGVQRLVL